MVLFFLFLRGSEQEGQRERGGENLKQAPLPELDTGLDPMTLRSQAEPKPSVGTPNQLDHPGAPKGSFLKTLNFPLAFSPQLLHSCI